MTASKKIFKINGIWYVADTDDQAIEYHKEWRGMPIYRLEACDVPVITKEDIENLRKERNEK